jgi:hypothetical protein
VNILLVGIGGYFMVGILLKDILLAGIDAYSIGGY